VKEMTKVHEKVYRGQIRELLESLPEDEIKGEFVIIIDGKGKNIL
jgi:16S rRNA C1402 (ribose-2'-O) methylase RsmI